MVKKKEVPDAWDDDWESLADRAEEDAIIAPPDEPATLSKADRLAKHTESNKQLWESAETPETFHFLATKDNVPLKTEFKPTLKVLSRKPTPKRVEKQDPITGLSQMTIEDDDDEDEDSKKAMPTAEELRLKAEKDLEERQKRYAETRARLFGTSDTGSGASSPGNVTPPQMIEDSKGTSVKGKGRAGSGRKENRRQDPQPRTKELYDPNYTPKPGSISIQKRGTDLSGRPVTREDEQVIRSPRGPDTSGRGGFANRGGKVG